MPTDDDNCVVLFYKGERYWVGNVTTTDRVPLLCHVLKQLVSALESGESQWGNVRMGGVEK